MCCPGQCVVRVIVLSESLCCPGHGLSEIVFLYGQKVDENDQAVRSIDCPLGVWHHS